MYSMFAPCDVIRNPTFFWFRNPEYGVLESGIQAVKSGIQITEESGIQSPGSSEIHCFINLEKNTHICCNHIWSYFTGPDSFYPENINKSDPPNMASHVIKQSVASKGGGEKNDDKRREEVMLEFVSE
jgi:hypothetical protein